MSVWSRGQGGGGGGCCMGAMKYAYGFCISWMSVLCMISSLRVATLCHGNNHNHRPWLKTLYVARVSSTQASCSCKAKSILLPESNSSSFYTQIWNLSKVKTTTAFFSKSWRILVVVAKWRHHINDVFKVKKKTALPVYKKKKKIENSERGESQKKWGEE